MVTVQQKVCLTETFYKIVKFFFIFGFMKSCDTVKFIILQNNFRIYRQKVANFVKKEPGGEHHFTRYVVRMMKILNADDPGSLLEAFTTDQNCSCYFYC